MKLLSAADFTFYLYFMRFFLYTLLTYCSGFIFSQEVNFLNEKISQRVFSGYSYSSVPKRSFVSLKDKSFFTKINPLTYVSGALLFVYQRCFSEQIQANCTYEISCSNYTKSSIEKHGALRGLLMGLDQLSCCFPGHADELERCSIGREGKVMNWVTED